MHLRVSNTNREDPIEVLESCYWIRGYSEVITILNLNDIDKAFFKILDDHLNLVFDKATPQYDTLFPVDTESEKGDNTQPEKDTLKKDIEEMLERLKRTPPPTPIPSIIFPDKYILPTDYKPLRVMC